MKLTRIEVKNYRSLFADKGAPTTALDLAEGMNALVGPNNTGKSNLLRAVALALDPDFPFDRDKDMPSALMFAFPRVTLEFACEGKTSSERTLLGRAEDYEKSIPKPPKKTYAGDGIVRFTVTFPGNDRFGATRQEIIGIRGAGARQGDVQKLDKAVTQLRRTLRFVMIEWAKSGGRSSRQVPGDPQIGHQRTPCVSVRRRREAAERLHRGPANRPPRAASGQGR